MPWRVTVEKVLSGEFWTNRYILSSASLADAYSAALDTIIPAERAVTSNYVTFVKVRVDDMVPNTDNYQTGILNMQGLRNVTGDLMPLYVVARVDFTVNASSPSRKYLRGVLYENDVTGPLQVSAGTQTVINDAYVAPMVALASFVDVDGQDIVGGATNPNVGMRQLRRGSKKKLTL